MIIRRSSLGGMALPTLVLFVVAFAPFARSTPKQAAPAVAVVGLQQDGFLTAPQSGDPSVIALDYLRRNTSRLGLTPADLADMELTDRYVSPHTSVTHLYLEQRANGIPVHNAINRERNGRSLCATIGETDLVYQS